MLLEALVCGPLDIAFKTGFSHASATRQTTQTLWVQAVGISGATGIGEGCPRDYVSGETSQSAQQFVRRFQKDWIACINDMASLARWADDHRLEIDQNPAAWAAVEIALIDLIGKSTGRSAESLLGLPELTGQFVYTAVLGDASVKAFAAQLDQYVKAGFQTFKIKLSGDRERDLAKVMALRDTGIDAAVVRADANNVWSDALHASDFLAALDFPFWAIEEPLRAGDLAGMLAISRARNCRIILDESLLRLEQIAPFAEEPAHWIVNLRVSKMGGLMRSLAMTHRLQAAGLELIVGAHVGETSVLTRASMTVAQAAGKSLLGQEGAFGTHLLMHDMVEPILQFGARGALQTSMFGIAGMPGFGLHGNNVIAKI
ncbi:MAG: enolase C-terminal domain-like protein [Pseudomonadota bacterium]